MPSYENIRYWTVLGLLIFIACNKCCLFVYQFVTQIKGLGLETLLAALHQKFSEWQAHDETGAGWGFMDVLAL